MDFKFILQIFQILLALAFVLSLSYMALRMTKKLTDGNARYMKIVEKTTLGKDSYLAIIKIGEGYELVSVAQGNIQMIREIPKEEMEKLITDREAMIKNNPMATYFKKAKKNESHNLTALLQKVKTRKPRE